MSECCLVLTSAGTIGVGRLKVFTTLGMSMNYRKSALNIDLGLQICFSEEENLQLHNL